MDGFMMHMLKKVLEEKMEREMERDQKPDDPNESIQVGDNITCVMDGIGTKISGRLIGGATIYGVDGFRVLSGNKLFIIPMTRIQFYYKEI